MSGRDRLQRPLANVSRDYHGYGGRDDPPLETLASLTAERCTFDAFAALRPTSSTRRRSWAPRYLAYEIQVLTARQQVGIANPIHIRHARLIEAGEGRWKEWFDG